MQRILQQSAKSLKAENGRQQWFERQPPIPVVQNNEPLTENRQILPLPDECRVSSLFSSIPAVVSFLRIKMRVRCVHDMPGLGPAGLRLAVGEIGPPPEQPSRTVFTLL